MLETKRSITLTGEIKVPGSDQIVIYITGTISKDGGEDDNIVQVIEDAKLYDENKEAVRNEVDKFMKLFYEVQDRGRL
ncbi:hypothetical protein [Anaerostipes hominis (ex Lee et al. 2021)]|uniref:hypothetical protein n=1 Tax=Anaerostipes hominis (ex Lee et al. 2021) TaxID=2025494 RepID=UPI0022E14032|nr:hypothetical protein [Anaerostipes hominis (ex Lee et al. 2021)]